jgi:hypothetical protein
MAQSRVTSSRPGSTRRPPAPPRSSSRSRLPLLIAGAVAVVLAALAVWVATRGGGDPDSVAAPATDGQGGEVEVAHVHGLGIDPADGAVLAGTHYGLFRLPGTGAPERVADRVQDFMGFSVVGPEHYLASGHPGTGQGGPSSLGLIESTDGGQTWESLSLAGEADFHALEARHDRVYGLNSMTGEFLVSTDGRTWETRNAGVPLADFAVSPDDPELLVATTQEGPARSTDGGRSFSVLDGAPLLLLVDWADDGALVGVAPDGAVHGSEDGGATWTARGSVNGAPQALEASDGGQVVVAIDGAIVESGDGGESFDVRYQTS